ncbi:MAG TPA: 2-phospho-L-lactate transferase CofD family protein, partial [Polyangiales bacterium]|nr:2-phospho-L-lactate transferase CofD family protein [Polyangiales bacterium]
MSFAHVVYLSGGVGGARLLDGMARVLEPETLTAIVNTGDDLTHWGLRVCPDIDTILYTLSGLGDAKRGWGLRGESFRALEGVERYGGESWFQLGDRDLATHIVRSERLRKGETLTAITARLARALGVTCAVLPMCDE